MQNRSIWFIYNLVFLQECQKSTWDFSLVLVENLCELLVIITARPDRLLRDKGMYREKMCLAGFLGRNIPPKWIPSMLSQNNKRNCIYLDALCFFNSLYSVQKSLKKWEKKFILYFKKYLATEDEKALRISMKRETPKLCAAFIFNIYFVENTITRSGSTAILIVLGLLWVIAFSTK